RYEIPLPDRVRLGSWDIPMISPNGQKLVFTGVGSDGKRRLWFRSLDSTLTYALPGTEDASTPFWSPDSRFVAFYAESRIKKIDPTGCGLPVTLCDLNGMKWFNGGTWSQNGVILFSAVTQGDHNPQLYRVPDEGGAMTPAGRFDKARHEKLQWCPHFLPDGRHFVYWSGTIEPERASICLGSLDSFETRSLITAQSN